MPATVQSAIWRLGNTAGRRKQNWSQEDGHPISRHLTLRDLLCVGLGGTIGSGLFVLSGLVANRFAGPASLLSWGLAGLAASLSGLVYAEFSGRIPLAGSAYAFCYVSVGEYAAILAASCLSIQYIVASSAVARSWGDKVSLYLSSILVLSEDETRWWYNPDGCLNVFAFAISSATVLLLCMGIHESKTVTNVFTAVKILLVVFMVTLGLGLVQTSHLVPFAPFGWTGVMRGATSTFFGFLGYDQICGLSGETLDPKRDMPRAICLTLILVSVVYMLASVALCGMQSYTDISSVSGFPSAFDSLDFEWAAHITAVGELLTLPIVLLVTVQVQPRLLYAMAEDGLVPSWFKELDGNRNLWNGTCFAGFFLVAFSTLVPFSHLNDVISCAVLSALILTNSSLILMWHEDPKLPESCLAEWLLLVFNGCALLTALCATYFLETWLGRWLAVCGGLGMVALSWCIYVFTPRAERFGGRRQHFHGDQVKTDTGYFETPFVPFLPCLATYVNWHLIAQLDVTGVAGVLGLWVVVTIYYVFFAVHHSIEESESTTGRPVEIGSPMCETSRLMFYPK